jgi:hypothetical protein
MNSTNQTNLVMNYPAPNTDMTVGLAAEWDYSDECSGISRVVNADECNTMLSAALNDCDTDTLQDKYGGWKTNNCIVWNVEISGENTIPQPQPPASPPGSHSCSSPLTQTGPTICTRNSTRLQYSPRIFRA